MFDYAIKLDTGDVLEDGTGSFDIASRLHAYWCSILTNSGVQLWYNGRLRAWTNDPRD